MYVFHNKIFQERATKDQFLQEKFDFLHTYVFGEYFFGSSYEKDAIPTKLWDVTKIGLKNNALSEVFVFIRATFSLTKFL